MKKDIHNYDDIINMPRHTSSKHPQMKIIDRAAQFAPFAALTGHKESINEASRITDSKKELDENQKEILNNKLNYILLNLDKLLEIKITYFQADLKKSGGKYVTVLASIKKIDEYNKVLVLNNGKKIKIDDLYWLEW
ncbi:hypothetical protein [Thomasclavelia spiroformis]|uniref:hypothetical protein n=1 Tax=Thomasclavelia spiroformis TaxID=29348 RepID=UPI00241CC6E8|nr:hypothetical protein [Thomasclavelia spiroformis]